MALSVVAFGSLFALALLTVGEQFDELTVDGRQSVELSGTTWHVAVPADAPNTQVVITDPSGQPVPIDPVRSGDRSGDELSDPPDPSVSDWHRIGEIRIDGDGSYLVDAGRQSVQLTNVDLGGTVVAIGLFGLAFVVGLGLFFIGGVILVVALIVRFT